MSNYKTKSEWKSATGVDTLQFAKNADLASLKTTVDKLDIEYINFKIYQVV